MKLTESQYQRIADCLPRQRGNVSMTNLELLNALLYMVEHGCKWRGLPKQFGIWHTIYTRMNRWSKAGVLDQVFAQLQQEQILAISSKHVCLDSIPRSKCIPDGTGGGPLKKTGRKPSGAPAGGCTTKIHLVAASGPVRVGIIKTFSGPGGRCARRTRTIGPQAAPCHGRGCLLING